MRSNHTATLMGAVVSLSVLASTPGWSQGVSEEQAASNRAKPYVAGMDAVRRFSSQPGCDGESVAAARASIDELDAMERKAKPLRSLPSMGATFAAYEAEARERRWEVQFGLADSAKSKGCLDLADGLYRELINIYIGSAFGGIRDRARLGVDDVRAARK